MHVNKKNKHILREKQQKGKLLYRFLFVVRWNFSRLQVLPALSIRLHYSTYYRYFYIFTSYSFLAVSAQYRNTLYNPIHLLPTPEHFSVFAFIQGDLGGYINILGPYSGTQNKQNSSYKLEFYSWIDYLQKSPLALPCIVNFNRYLNHPELN